MLDKYIDWNKAASEMLRHQGDNCVALQSLREEYAELEAASVSIGATDYSKPRVTGASGDPQEAIVNRILRKQIVENRIRELEREAEICNQAWNALTDDERRVLHEFYRCGRRSGQSAVDALCNEFNFEQATIYRKRNAALSRFKTLLAG